MTSKTTRSKAFPTELRERALRLVREQEAEHATRAAAIRSVAAKVGCHADTLRLWLRDAKRDDGPAVARMLRPSACSNKILGSGLKRISFLVDFRVERTH